MTDAVKNKFEGAMNLRLYELEARGIGSSVHA